ncbi:MAG: hypothetical protein IPM97_17110 [Bdellovibrionaceae bacterium]|nr:hypothetical protein [Pseudobdellovibrionaceae bacterium]
MDYSTKYRVSVSTLRRRIKTEDIKFRFDDGKYFIIDEPMSTHQRVHRPSLDSDLAPVGTHQGSLQAPNSLHLKTDISDKIAMAKNDEPILTAANKLLTELKKAYTQILQEKEEQMLHLKEEVTDLKTLVRVLEGENDRLKGNGKGFI